MRYRPDIDGLRAVAVMSVIAFHAFPGRLSGGYVGVDVFFVISGYLISGLILTQFGGGRFRLADFYARRIRRIVPALIAILIFTTLAGWLLLLPDEYAQLKEHVVSAGLFVSNFTLWSEVGYFDNDSALKPLLHLWSLGVEEQFYLLWPLALITAWRAELNVAIWVVAIAIASFGLMIYLGGVSSSAAFYSPVAQFWELMLGAAIATAPTLEIVSRVRRDMLSISGIALIGLAVVLPNDHVALAGWRLLVPTIGAALVIVAGPSGWANQHLLARRGAVYIGLISYPLYLWHWPLLSFFAIIDPVPPPIRSVPIKFAIVALTLALSAATYRFIEIPIRSTKSPRYAGPLLGGLAATCLVALLGGIPAFWGHGTDPFAWAETRSRSCIEHYGLGPNTTFCVEFGQMPPSISVIGDSYANHWMPGLEAVFSNTGILNLYGCFPFAVDGVLREDECIAQTNHILEAVQGNAKISTVMLAWYMAPHVTDANAMRVAAELEATLGELLNRGKRVAIMLDVPNLGFDPRSCLHLRATKLRHSATDPCAVLREDVLAKERPARASVATAARAFADVSVFDPLEVLCKGDLCYGIIDEMMMYRDSAHLSTIGTQYVLSRLIKDWRN